MDDSLTKTVHVSNLDNAVSEPQLRYLFGSCGQIASLRLMGDGIQKRRYAFVEYTTSQAAATAMNLNSYPLGNSILRVNPAKTPPMANKTQQNIMAAAGLPPHVAQALGILPGQRDGTPLTPEKQDALSRTVHVSGLDLRVGERELAEFFQAYAGPVLKLRLGGDTSRGNRFAFVEFVEQSKAVVALQLSDSIIGANSIKISMAKSPILTDQNVYYVNPPPGITPGMYQPQLQAVTPLQVVSNMVPVQIPQNYGQPPQQPFPPHPGMHQQGMPPMQHQGMPPMQQQMQQMPPMQQHGMMPQPGRGPAPQFQPLGSAYQPPIRSFPGQQHPPHQGGPQQHYQQHQQQHQQPVQPQIQAQPVVRPPASSAAVQPPSSSSPASQSAAAPTTAATSSASSDETSSSTSTAAATDAGSTADQSDKKRKDPEETDQTVEAPDADEAAQKKIKTEA